MPSPNRDKKVSLCILLVGYRRLDLLLDNIERSFKVHGCVDSVYISIDGSKSGEQSASIEVSEVKEFLNKAPNREMYKVNKMPSNLGPDAHILWAIDWAFKDNDSVIVIEDDVKLSPKSIEAIAVFYIGKTALDKPTIVVAMSAVSMCKSFPNYWRESIYFTAWGYALNYHFWLLYKKNEPLLRQTELIDNFLAGSEDWRNLSARKKSIWRERIRRGNYDYKIQAIMWRESIRSNAPLFRISDNLGHGSAFSSHTRFSTPRYLKKRVSDYDYRFRGRITAKLANRLMIFADSNSWGGDGLLSLRGRSAGLRTQLKKLLFKNKV